MRALLTTMHDLRDALEAAANGRRAPEPKAPRRNRPAVPTPDQIEAAEFHAAEIEEDYGPLARDASFDERWPPADFDDGATFDDADFQPITD